MVAMKDIQEYSDAIAREFRPSRIILFGSHARGEAGVDSDVDLLVVMTHRGHPTEKAIEVRKRIARTFALDLLVRSPGEIEKRLQRNDWFIREIIEQGKVLYEGHDQGMGRKSRSRLPQRRAGNEGKKGPQL